MAQLHVLIFFRWKLGQQVRPIASNDPTDFVVHNADILKALNLPTDHFKFLGAEGAIV